MFAVSVFTSPGTSTERRPRVKIVRSIPCWIAKLRTSRADEARSANEQNLHGT